MIGFIQFFGAIIILTIVSWGLYSSRHTLISLPRDGADSSSGARSASGLKDSYEDLPSVVQQLRDKIKALEDELKSARQPKTQIQPTVATPSASSVKPLTSSVPIVDINTTPSNQSSSSSWASTGPVIKASNTTNDNPVAHHKSTHKSKVKKMQDAATIMGLETSIMSLGEATKKSSNKGLQKGGHYKETKNATFVATSSATSRTEKGSQAAASSAAGNPPSSASLPSVSAVDKKEIKNAKIAVGVPVTDKDKKPPTTTTLTPAAIVSSSSAAAAVAAADKTQKIKSKSLADEVLDVLGKTEEVLPVSVSATTVVKSEEKNKKYTAPPITTATGAPKPAAGSIASGSLTAIKTTPSSATSLVTSSLNHVVTSTTNRSSVNAAYNGPYYYMYELDEEFWWRWPKPGTDCSKNGYVGHEHAELSGMGPALIPENGLFLTWHFSLFSSLFNRLKRSRRRTYDPEKASLFVIPYDLGLDGYLNANTCRNSRKCTRGLPEKLQGILTKSKYFQRYDGADHVVLWSLGQYHPWPANGCDLFMRNFCGKCAFTCYWMDPTKAGTRFISVPFPSGYHWWDGIKNIPWALSPPGYRNLTAVYLGSTQTLNPAHTKIRRAMTAQCNVSTECHWMQIAHSSKDASIADYLSIYKKSIFCLCPPGDDPARKAVFDSILSGCIPVIFEVATLYNQYPWHLGEQTALDISVSIPGGLVRSGKLDFMSVLLAIPPDVIRKKQEALALVAPRIQYAMPPLDLLKNRSDATQWDPPFPDGVDVIVDGLFDRVGLVLSNQSTGIPHRLMTSAEWSREYDVIKVKVPGEPMSGTGATSAAGGSAAGGGGGGSVTGFGSPRGGRGDRVGGGGGGRGHRKRMGPAGGPATAAAV